MSFTDEQKVSIALGIVPDEATLIRRTNSPMVNQYYMYIDGYWYKYYDNTFTGKRDPIDPTTQRRLTKDFLGCT